MTYKLTGRIISSLRVYRIFRYHHGKKLITLVNDERFRNWPRIEWKYILGYSSISVWANLARYLGREYGGSELLDWLTGWFAHTLTIFVRYRFVLSAKQPLGKAMQISAEQPCLFLSVIATMVLFNTPSDSFCLFAWIYRELTNTLFILFVTGLDSGSSPQTSSLAKCLAK